MLIDKIIEAIEEDYVIFPKGTSRKVLLNGAPNTAEISVTEYCINLKRRNHHGHYWEKYIEVERPDIEKVKAKIRKAIGSTGE